MSVEDFTQEYIDAFDRLFLEFRDIEGEFKYVNRINRMIRDGQLSLVIDYPDLILMDNITEANLSNKIIDEPDIILENGNESLRNFIERENPSYFRNNRKEKFFVRFKKLPNNAKIRDIRSKDVDEIFELDGIIIRTTEIKSILEYAEFRCENEHMIRLPLTWGQYQTPSRCSDFDCDSKKFFAHPINKDDMIDWQFITLQEKPEDLPPGSSPKSIPCRLVYDLVNTARPGDRVSMTGIIRSRENKLKKRGQVLTYDNWVEVNYIESISKEDELTKITPQEEQEFMDLASDPQIFDHLVDSLAPQIHKMEKIKQAALLMLFSGVDKSHPDGFSTRGQPNILLVGDPGVAKSQLLRYVKSIAPRGLYTSGKGSSAAGLTAAIIRDPETGEITLEAGAMVLADRGVCVSGDTLILCADGSSIDIQTIVDCGEKPSIISFDAETHTTLKDEITGVSSRFSTNVFDLTFSTTDKLTITGEHPLPIWDNGIQWKTVDEMKVNDVLIDFREYAFQHEEEFIHDEYAEFLGLICSDGSLSKEKYRITFYSNSRQLLDRYKHLVDKLFDVNLGLYVDKRNDVSQYYFNNKKIHTQLRSIGIPNHNKSKSDLQINSLFRTRPETIKSFFVGLINGDGSISNRKGGGIIDIVVGNMNTALFYRKLLRRIGVIARVHTRSNQGGGVAPVGEYIAYVVSITGYHNMARMQHPQLLDHKRENLQKILARRDLDWRIYNIDKIIDEISDMLPHGQKYLLYENSLRKSTLKRYGTTRAVLKKMFGGIEFIPQLKGTRQLEAIERILSREMHFIKLVSKERARPQKVYNLEVQKNNTYFANFIPVHNCLIDEFDKMNENDRSAIHEAMEQHTVSIAKAGIVATLNARTGVLAAANPKYGRYEDYRPFSENVNLSPAILSRFDLVFIIRDIPKEEDDQKLASHILKLHRFHGSSDSRRPPLDEERLRKYIAFAKKNYNPILTEPAAERIEAYYVDMRNNYAGAGDNPQDRITITARQLEGIIRLAEAHARARLRDEVTEIDAEFAIELMKFSLNQITRDPETGEYDYDAFISGQTKSRRSKLNQVRDAINFMHKDAGGSFDEREMIEFAIKEGQGTLTDEYVRGTIQQMLIDGTLYRPRRGKLDKP